MSVAPMEGSATARRRRNVDRTWVEQARQDRRCRRSRETRCPGHTIDVQPPWQAGLERTPQAGPVGPEPADEHDPGRVATDVVERRRKDDAGRHHDRHRSVDRTALRNCPWR